MLTYFAYLTIWDLDIVVSVKAMLFFVFGFPGDICVCDRAFFRGFESDDPDFDRTEDVRLNCGDERRATQPCSPVT